MREIVYKYSNNGQFPVKYVKKSRSGYIENVIIDHVTGEEIVFIKESHLRSLENLSTGYSTKGVSQATRRKIAKASRVLGIGASPHKVRNSKGEYITHLVTFITLTLPSSQKENDQFITKNILGTFLDRCRKLGILSNYVWRAEKQNNGNIHYHIITDSFAMFSLFKRLWYISLRKYGYIQAYSDKFSKMTFDEYKCEKFNEEKDIRTIAAAFERGNRLNWSEPPCVDVKFVSDISGVSKYVSKYISKENKDAGKVEGRVWGCSQSVSSLVTALCTDEELSMFWYNVGNEVMKRKVIVHEYFSIVLFKYTSLIAWYGDTLVYIRSIVDSCFSGCLFYKNSIGLYS